MTAGRHRIEEESYRLLRERVDLSHLPAVTRAVVERVVHATADTSFASTMVVDEEAARRAVRALSEGAPVVTDVEMVRAGIPGSLCYLGQAREEPAGATTLSARGIRLAARAHEEGALFAVGCAPSALDELVSLAEEGSVRPLLVVGVPVGYVGAAEAKERLRAARPLLPAISNRGERGGSAVAAAVVNALTRLAAGVPGEKAPPPRAPGAAT